MPLHQKKVFQESKVLKGYEKASKLTYFPNKSRTFAYGNKWATHIPKISSEILQKYGKNYIAITFDSKRGSHLEKF